MIVSRLEARRDVRVCVARAIRVSVEEGIRERNRKKRTQLNCNCLPFDPPAMYLSSIHRSDIVDVAMKSVTMDDIARSVAHLTDHIRSTLSPQTSGSDCLAVDCSTSEGAGTSSASSSSSSDVYEGTLGFTNHTKFLQNLCGGPRSWKFGKQSFPPWFSARSRPPATPSQQEKSSVFSYERIESNAQNGEKIEVVRTKLEYETSEQNRIEFEGPPSVKSYSNPSASLLESLANNEVNLGSAVSKEDLGRATWTFLHTLAAQFPEHPTKQQQRDAKDLMGILSRIYPCKECADHFKDVLKAHPVEVKSGEQLAQWMCRVHNVVNRRYPL